MKKRLLLLLLISFSLIPACPANKRAQESTQDTLIKTRLLRETVEQTPRGTAIRYRDVTPSAPRWSFKIAYGMAFGNQTTFNVIPQVSYRQSVYFSVGGGLNYIYYYLSHHGERERIHYAGINVFARISPFPYLIFQVQPELFGRWGKADNHRLSGRAVPVFLAGGGFNIPAGPGNIELLFLFDIIQNDYTPYGKNLYYSIGYSFRF